MDFQKPAKILLTVNFQDFDLKNHISIVQGCNCRPN